ncbi:hypothetical protein M0R45_026477 [Rubus argutus]|uniref:RRM domain-containing protein n=1 Tax=Rubus argutus TaxID=59490 RepID=A0AAW1WX90_RUBAR
MMYIMLSVAGEEINTLKNQKKSMDYGFVEFDSVETATNAYKDLQLKPKSALEATKKDLRHPFSTFDEIKGLRFPNRLGRHRGFAFFEFVAEQEAKNAIQELSSTHLYGRHLVLERAKEYESLEV